jgi:hypothetical protein
MVMPPLLIGTTRVLAWATEIEFKSGWGIGPESGFDGNVAAKSRSGALAAPLTTVFPGCCRGMKLAPISWAVKEKTGSSETACESGNSLDFMRQPL